MQRSRQRKALGAMSPPNVWYQARMKTTGAHQAPLLIQSIRRQWFLNGSRTKKPGRFYFEDCPNVEGVLRVMTGRNPTRVFAHPNGLPLGYKFALAAFKKAQEDAGLEGYRLHDYRRSVARRLELNPNVTRAAAMKITGHRTEHVFRQYSVEGG